MCKHFPTMDGMPLIFVGFIYYYHIILYHNIARLFTGGVENYMKMPHICIYEAIKFVVFTLYFHGWGHEKQHLKTCKNKMLRNTRNKNDQNIFEINNIIKQPIEQ